MREISNNKVNNIREDILSTIKDGTLTHEQKIAALANHADAFMDVLDYVEGLDELLNKSIEEKCICDLFEGNAPVRPRYIVPDYNLLIKKGCQFLKLDPPKDLYEVINVLLIFYKHVPSVTNYPVYLGQLDELLEPFVKGVDKAHAKKLIKMFLQHIDRTVLDAFAHANIGPKATLTGSLILEAEAELEDAVPNITLKYDEDITPDDYAIEAVNTTLKSAKPSFANHKMFKRELDDDYAIVSCYNGLKIGGGSYTLSRLVLGNIAKKSVDTHDFLNIKLPHVMDVMAKYMDARIKFEVEESGFFENSFLVEEGFVKRERFTAMFGLVGLADAVNILFSKEGKKGRFGHDEAANDLGVEIMEKIEQFRKSHKNPYCEISDGNFVLHAQVGISDDIDITPGVRIPIGEEPENMIDHLMVLNRFHKYFPSGAGDIFPMEQTVKKNPEHILNIVKGSFKKDLRYLSFYSSDSDVIRVTGYLVKKSEMEKLDKGRNVLTGTTALGLDSSKNCKVLQRRVQS